MKNLLPLAIVCALFGCSAPERDQVADLESEVMAIHDEVMPQMDHIMSLKSKISKKIQSIDSLENVGVSNNTMAAERIKASDLNEQLNASDEKMMSWMHEYKGDSAKKLDEAAAISYFEKEKTKILDVKQLTLKSVQEAEAFLK